MKRVERTIYPIFCSRDRDCFCESYSGDCSRFHKASSKPSSVRNELHEETKVDETDSEINSYSRISQEFREVPKLGELNIRCTKWKYIVRAQDRAPVSDIAKGDR